MTLSSSRASRSISGRTHVSICLKHLDLVVAAIHHHFDLPRDAQTERVVRAMDNRHVSILAHPTARLIGQRESYENDIQRIIEATRERGCHVELNAKPDRLDLDDVHVRAAKAMGVKFAVSTDAHVTSVWASIRRAAAGLKPAMCSTRDRFRAAQAAQALTVLGAPNVRRTLRRTQLPRTRRCGALLPRGPCCRRTPRKHG